MFRLVRCAEIVARLNGEMGVAKLKTKADSAIFVDAWVAIDENELGAACPSAESIKLVSA